MTKPLKFEVRERLEAVVHLEGLAPDKEQIALWTVRLLVPKIVAMIRAAAKAQQSEGP